VRVQEQPNSRFEKLQRMMVDSELQVLEEPNNSFETQGQKLEDLEHLGRGSDYTVGLTLAELEETKFVGMVDTWAAFETRRLPVDSGQRDLE